MSTATTSAPATPGNTTITAANYYQDKTRVTSSQVRSFLDCPARTLAIWRDQYSITVTEPMMVGGYLDAMFEGTAARYCDEHPEMFRRDGQLRAAFTRVPELYKRAASDPFFMSFASGETQHIATGEIEGVPFKGKLDFLQDDKIVDLKTTANLWRVFAPHLGRYASFAEARRYDIQAAVYQELIRQETGKRLPFYIAAITTEPVPDLAVLEIPQQDLDDALELVRLNAPEFQALRIGIGEPERCGHCDYCKETKKLNKVTDWRNE